MCLHPAPAASDLLLAAFLLPSLLATKLSYPTCYKAWDAELAPSSVMNFFSLRREVASSVVENQLQGLPIILLLLLIHI